MPPPQLFTCGFGEFEAAEGRITRTATPTKGELSVAGRPVPIFPLVGSILPGVGGVATQTTPGITHIKGVLAIQQTVALELWEKTPPG